MSPRTLEVVLPRDFYGQLLELLERATAQARVGYDAHRRDELENELSHDDWYIEELRKLLIAFGSGAHKVRVYLAIRSGLL